MSIFTTILASIVAIEHLYIMYLETFATHSDSTSRVFNMEKEELQRKSVTALFKNQGIYNGLLAVFLFYGIFTGNLEITSILFYVLLLQQLMVLLQQVQNYLNPRWTSYLGIDLYFVV